MTLSISFLASRAVFLAFLGSWLLCHLQSQLGKGLRNQNNKVELKTTKEKKDRGEVLEMLE